MISLSQNTLEWIEWRKNKIGASDCASILGISPWRNAYQLWEEKVGLKESFSSNYKMQRGIQLEPIARNFFNKKMGLNLQPKVFVHLKHDWMIASLDGVSEDGSIAVEIKCNGPKTHSEAVEGKVPDYYYCQLQHQMEVLNINRIYYLSYVENEENSVILNIEKDDKIIEKIIEKEKEFHDCIVNFSPPSQDYVEKNDLEWNIHVEEWKELKSKIDILEEQEKSKRELIIRMAEGKNCIGSGIKIFKEVKKGSINYKIIPEVERISLEKYRNPPIEYWKIIKEKKND